MARLHPVITLPQYISLARRRRLVVQGEAVLEAKLDGYLVIAYENRLFMGSGRRAPSWVYKVLDIIGVDTSLIGGRVAYLELYGRCLTPGGYHRRDRHCYRAALVDASRPYSWSSGVEDTILFSQSLGLVDRLALAERIGAETPPAKTVVLHRAPSAAVLRNMLTVFNEYEGYVLKLYRDKGHVLPPDHGAKLRGLLEVKVKHRAQLG